MNCEPLHHGSRVVNIRYKETADLIKQVVRNNFPLWSRRFDSQKNLKIRGEKILCTPGDLFYFILRDKIPQYLSLFILCSVYVEKTI